MVPRLVVSQEAALGEGTVLGSQAMSQVLRKRWWRRGGQVAHQGH